MENPETRLRDNCHEYVQDLQEKLTEIHDFARKRLNISSDSMKKQYDLKVNLHDYTVGDRVWYYNPQRKVGISGKLVRPWTGPYVLKSKLNDVLYRIQDGTKKPKVVHHDKLKPFLQGNY